MSPHRPTNTSARGDRALPGDQYLWDSRGEIDPEIVRLERTLQPLRYRPSATGAPLARHAPRAQAPARWQPTSLRAAAALALTIGGLMSIRFFTPSARERGAFNDTASWSVVALRGSPRVGDQSLRRDAEGLLRVGEWLETDAAAQAEVTVGGDIGSVKVQPGSRLRLSRSRINERRMELARGSIEAHITAPPRLFIVDTPSATAIDLGCAYRMRVDDSGGGEIEVTGGWVSIERDGVVSIVPGGAMCRTRPDFPPGTPFYRSATRQLIDALQAFDFESGGEAALTIILAQARDADSLTLWHLLARAPQSLRGLVFDRLAAITPPPPGVTQDAVVRGDSDALARWRDTFMWSPGR